MALATEEYRLQGIGQLLVLEKLLDKTKAIELHKLAAAEKISLLQYIVKNKILSAEQIALTLLKILACPCWILIASMWALFLSISLMRN